MQFRISAEGIQTKDKRQRLEEEAFNNAVISAGNQEIFPHGLQSLSITRGIRLLLLQQNKVIAIDQQLNHRVVVSIMVNTILTMRGGTFMSKSSYIEQNV